MNRGLEMELDKFYSVPRVRGDEPAEEIGRQQLGECSPRARG